MPHGAANPQRVDVLVSRMKSRDPLTRMPPLGVSVVDAEGVALISRWMSSRFNNHKEEAP